MTLPGDCGLAGAFQARLDRAVSAADRGTMSDLGPPAAPPTLEPGPTMTEPVPPARPERHRGPGQPFTTETARAAHRLSYAPTSARYHPKPPTKPREPLSPPVAPNEEVSILTDQVRRTDRALRGPMSKLVRAQLGRTLVTLLSALRRAKGEAAPQDRGAQEPTAGLLE